MTVFSFKKERCCYFRRPGSEKMTNFTTVKFDVTKFCSYTLRDLEQKERVLTKPTRIREGKSIFKIIIKQFKKFFLSRL